MMRQNIFNINNLFALLLVMGLTFTGCDPLYEGDEFKVYEQEEPEGPQLPELPEIGKKGVCITQKGDSWSGRVSALKGHWHYSWGAGLNLAYKEPDNIDFVPMFWGGNILDETVTELKHLAAEGKIQYILGFNEPDATEQANMTVEKAIEKWPKLEEIGLPLISPAPAHWNGKEGVDWLEDFMTQADNLGYRVDYIGIHLYYGISVQKYLDILAAVYEKYGKPIWITEFAVADWGSTPETNRYSPEQVLTLMKELLPKLEELPYVYRYAWFGFGQNAMNGASSALFDTEGNLTALGEYYANFKSNDLIGSGKDDAVDPDAPIIDPNDVVVNGTFETGDISPWLGFKNGVVGNDFMGSYCGRLESNDASLFQVIDVEPGATYEVKFHAKWGAIPPKTFPFAVKEETGSKTKFYTQDIVANENDWTLNKVTFTATTEAKVRLLWYKGKVTPSFPVFYLDNVSCIKQD